MLDISISKNGIELGEAIIISKNKDDPKILTIRSGTKERNIIYDVILSMG